MEICGDAKLALTMMRLVSMLEGWLGPHQGCGTLYGEGVVDLRAQV